MIRNVFLFLLCCSHAAAGELGATSRDTVTIRVSKAVGIIVRQNAGESCINPGPYDVHSAVPPCAGEAATPNVIINTQDSSGVIMLTIKAI